MMKTIIFFLFMNVTGGILMAQESAYTPLYPKGKIPNAKKSNIPEIKETDPNGIVRISGVTEPAMRYYPADPAKSRGSAIVICPGGGYTILAISHEGEDVAQAFASQGIAAFVLKYRLPSDAIMEDKSIGPLQDVQQAFKLIREKAEDYHINPDKIGVIGFSAGGHLASSAGVHYRDVKIDNPQNISLKPNFMILLYPVISTDTTFGHMGSRQNLLGKNPNPALDHYFSNETQVDKETAPTFLVHAEDDKTVPIENSKRFYAALQKNGVPSKLLTYPAGGHGFGLINKTTSDRWFNHALEWLHEQGF